MSKQIVNRIRALEAAAQAVGSIEDQFSIEDRAILAAVIPFVLDGADAEEAACAALAGEHISPGTNGAQRMERARFWAETTLSVLDKI